MVFFFKVGLGKKEEKILRKILAKIRQIN